MKKLCAVLALIMAGCATHPPPASIAPAQASNTATRAAISASRKDIQLSQAKSAAGASALQKADANLSALLGAPRTELPQATPIPTPTPTPSPTPKPKKSFWTTYF